MIFQRASWYNSQFSDAVLQSLDCLPIFPKNTGRYMYCIPLEESNNSTCQTIRELCTQTSFVMYFANSNTKELKWARVKSNERIKNRVPIFPNQKYILCNTFLHLVRVALLQQPTLPVTKFKKLSNFWYGDISPFTSTSEFEQKSCAFKY